MLLTNVAVAVIGFYLIIASNFLKELIGCHLQEVLNTNMFVKHFLGFLLLTIFIILINPENADLRVFEIIGLAIFVYLWFILTTRSHYIFALLTLLLLLAVYILNSTIERYKKQNDIQSINLIKNIQLTLVVSALVLTIIGFSIYVIEKKNEYSNKFEFIKFLVGKPKCKNFTSNKSKVI
jgi:hypothetical protein